MSVVEAIKHGYAHPRDIDGVTCGLYRMLFTVGVFYDIDDGGSAGRICFDTWQNAELFLKDWDARSIPEVGVDGVKAIKLSPSATSRIRRPADQ